MSVANSIRSILDQQELQYWLVPHEETESLEQAARVAGIPAGRVARGVVLRDDIGTVVAIVPLSHLIDFTLLGELMGRHLEPVSSDFVESIFGDCPPGSIPPLASGYRCTVVVDSQFKDFDSIYFEPGSRTDLIRISGEDFVSLQGDDVTWGDFTSPQDHLVSDIPVSRAGEVTLPEAFRKEVDALTPAPEVKRRIEQLYDLPPIPQIATELLRMQTDPTSTIEHLSDVVELDPSLAAQVVRYARSPFFGYRGHVDTIQDAITRVLGFDMVIHMALGIAAGQSFKNPPDGPLGLVQFWRHATYSGALAQALVMKMPAEKRLKPGLCYLSGLLHNFGFLLLGHLFQPEFFLLNKLVSANPQVPVTALEKHVLAFGHAKQALGLGHAEMGAWLMQSWKMPAEVVVSMREHHNVDYDGEHCEYSRMVLLVDHLLRQHNIGDANSAEIPGHILDALGIDQYDALDATDVILNESSRLDELARQLAA